MQDENNNNNLRRILKGLPKVKAKNDFEIHLYKRLRDVESEKFSSPSLKKLSRAGKRFSIVSLLKPSLISAVAVSIILLIFIAYYFNIILVNKNPSDQGITQNTQNTQPQDNNILKKDSEKQFSTSEAIENDKSLNRSNEQTLSTTTGTNEAEALREMPTPRTERDLEETISIPKVETKAIDELKVEEKEIEGNKIEMKNETPRMKKSDGIKTKDTGKQYDEDVIDKKVHLREDDSLNNQQKGIYYENPALSDTTKVIESQKKVSNKDKSYRDSVKIQKQNKTEIEDSTKNK